jgi:hypothetical protein
MRYSNKIRSCNSPYSISGLNCLATALRHLTKGCANLRGMPTSTFHDQIDGYVKPYRHQQIKYKSMVSGGYRPLKTMTSGGRAREQDIRIQGASVMVLFSFQPNWQKFELLRF